MEGEVGGRRDEGRGLYFMTLRFHPSLVWGDVKKVVVLGCTYHKVGDPLLPKAVVVLLFVWGIFFA